MRKLEVNDRLIIATHNKGKLREIYNFLSPFPLFLSSSKSLGILDPEETEDTFAKNAALKACFVAKQSGLPALSDDSGLVVPALGGAPGIYSARWAEKPDGTRDFTIAIQRLEKELKDIEDRSAHFISVLSLAFPDGQSIEFEGRCEGTLVFPGRGQRDFGFDAIFQIKGQTQTFAEMPPEQKEILSPRFQAFQKLEDYLPYL